MVVLKYCEPELSYVPAKLFNMCLKDSCFSECWMSHRWSLHLRMLGKGLLLKTTALLVLILWLVKSLKNLIGLLMTWRKKCGLFSDFQYAFRSSQWTADRLTVVSDKIARSFIRSGPTWAVALYIQRFWRVWYAGPFQECIACVCYFLLFLKEQFVSWLF